MRARGIALCLTLLALLGGCRTRRVPPARVVSPANELRLINHGARAVGGVRAKPCGSPESAYGWLPASNAAPGQSVGLPLREGCVDLSAVSPEGVELGRQFDLNMIPGSTWEIR